MSKNDLLPCPFCGGEAEVYDYEEERNIYDGGTLGYVDTEYFTKYGVGCSLCGCIIAEMMSEDEAIKTWNTRKPIDNIVAKLQEFAEASGINLDDMTEIIKKGGA